LAQWEEADNQEVKKVTLLKLARKGSTVSEISKRLKISQDEVELVIKAHQK